MRIDGARILTVALSSAVLCAAALATSAPAHAAGTEIDLVSTLKGQFPASEVYRSVPNFNITAADAARATIAPSFQMNNYGQLDGSPTVTPGQDLFMGHADLENRTNVTQQLQTSSYQKWVANTVTTSVTHGITGGGKVSVTLGLPSNNGTIEGTFERSREETNGYTTTEQEIYTSPAQSIAVPPNNICSVDVLLRQNISNGKVKLHSDIGGTYTARGHAYNTTFRATMPWASSHSVYNTFQQAQDGNGPKGPSLPRGISLDHNKKVVSFDGTGTYSVKAGTQYYVKVQCRNTKGGSAPAPRSYFIPVTR